MLLPVDYLFPNVPKVVPRTDSEVIVKNLLKEFSKKPWFESLWQDVAPSRRTSYVIKCKYPIDTTEYPSLYEGYLLSYTWESKCDCCPIEKVVEKFREKYRKKEWFYDVRVSDDGTYLEVTIKSWLNVNHRLDYFEKYPVRYGLLPKPKEEGVKMVLP